MAAPVVILAAVVLVAALVVAEGDDEGRLPGIVESVEVTRDPDNALRGRLDLRTAEPVRLTAMDVRAGDGHGLRVSPPGVPARRHTVPLLGLRPDRRYRVTVEMVPAGGGTTVTVEAGLIRTGSLPAGLPPVEVITARGARPALTLFDVTSGIPSASLGRTPGGGERRARHPSYLVVVDQAGEIVWYHRAAAPIQDARRTAAGTLLFIYNETGIREISPQGELVGEWIGITGSEVVTKDSSGRPIATDDAVHVETDQMHHALAELPNGNLLTLSREIRTLDYPENLCRDDSFDGTYRVAGDVVVEFERRSGKVVREFSLFDVLDPLANLSRTRPQEFCGSYLRAVYPDGGPVRDWSHANGVILDEGRNALIVSLRHTDSLVALRYADDGDGPAGALLWQLGEGGDFTMVGGGEWFLHAHAPEVLPDGSILLFDNGNERPGTALGSATPPYSRAVRYRLDEPARTVEQVWEHRAPPGEDPLYAPYVGDADPTPQGTVLITLGGLLEPVSHDPLVPGAVPWSRIVEIEPSSGRAVLDIRIREPDFKEGWRVYAAERLASIYPAGYRLEPFG